MAIEPRHVLAPFLWVLRDVGCNVDAALEAQLWIDRMPPTSLG
ncbi:MAG TPA: hypothetical protein VGU20_03355 [Stellaceae bacterium]|nr:hypothetical protein [Stellaceae bacterium]